MVALLVLATFAVFITADFLLHRDKYKFRVAESETPEAHMGPVQVVAGVALPETLAYHPGHAWALDAGNGRVRIGMDELAANLLGRIERVEVPQRGRWFRQGEKGWRVTTSQGEAEMLAPAEGEIVAVNERALTNPELISDDPYGRGWLLEIFSPDTQVSFRNLLSGSLARRWMEQSISELRQALAPRVAATALDGGRIAPRLGTELPQEKWRELTHRLFRS
jgi:glycine cleavage system H protein